MAEKMTGVLCTWLMCFFHGIFIKEKKGVFRAIIFPPNFAENKGDRKFLFSPLHPVQQIDVRKPFGFCFTVCKKGKRKLSFLYFTVCNKGDR